MKRAIVLITLAACGDNLPEPILNPPRDQYEAWEEVAPPGLVCGNDTQYKFWVNYSHKSDNLVVVFEPGGACWDYDSCTGKNGTMGAANPDGLPDDHYQLAPYISPFLDRDDVSSPSTEWNYVYVPYCTGDVHTGNVVATYTDETSPTQITYHHAGHDDVENVVSWIDQNFTHVPKMLVTGCSAGGVGSIVNYEFLRKGVHAVEQAYLLDDSGPIFPSSGYSGLMHAKIRQAWNLDSLADLMPPEFTFDDMGTLNLALADEFPHDRLATTFFQRDDDFSVYSYYRFYNMPDKDQIMQMWAADTQQFVNLYQQRKNLYYFLPYWRNLNSSHCTTVLTFAGSDIEDHNMTLAKWVNDFVNDNPIESMEEAPVPGEDP